MAGLQMPGDPRVNAGAPSFSNVWIQFFAGIARKFTAGAAVETVTTADASDLSTAIALANDLKATVNELVAAQKR